ncbi:MAG: putative monocarboxylate transporter mch1 [Piccolia ochrophora]|nr:MAG: putative monocarboxylate transporter mch1 [Piccolia ochrophora]
MSDSVQQRRTSEHGPSRSEARKPPLQHVDPVPESPSEQGPADGPDHLDADDHHLHRTRNRGQAARYASFGCAILNCLCAGSITAFSLYGHLFISRLGYSLLQVNIISVTAELAMYLPVPLWGYLCDRYTPRPLSFLSSCLFGPGYLLAAYTYRQGPPPTNGGDGWPFEFMVIAFAGVGAGTSSMYLAAVTACAKNFGRGPHKGIALAIPIAAFGLSGMWQSQVGSRLLYETLPDGSRGEVDVFRYFLFLGVTLLSVGLIGSMGLRVINEEDLIDDAVGELERSGLLEESEFFRRDRGYGTLDSSQMANREVESADETKRREREERRKKRWLVNTETRRFLKDRTMWALALGFLLVTGPGETFINNLGTIIHTLSPRPTTSSPSLPPPTLPSTHVSIVALTSTIARLLTGTLSDLFSPSSHTSRPSIPRPVLLLLSTLLLSLGLALLASGAVQAHAADRFWAVSAAVGAGYGAAFSLVPIVIGVVWGVENFGTNWGVVAMMPALGATAFSGLFSAGYGWAARGGGSGGGGLWGGGDGDGDGRSGGRGDGHDGSDSFCYGARCYQATFWVMTVSVWVACGLWFWAWKGRNGWSRRGIVV